MSKRRLYCPLCQKYYKHSTRDGETAGCTYTDKHPDSYNAKNNHKLIISTFQLRTFEKKENIQLEDFLIFDYRQAINADAIYFVERTPKIKKLK